MARKLCVAIALAVAVLAAAAAFTCRVGAGS